MRLLFSSPFRRQAHRLYMAVVAQARQPFLYKMFAIPDTLDGHFDAIVLHVALVTQRLKREPSAHTLTLARYLQEAFINDMDRSLRELGVSDTGVGKRIKQMGGALAGRLRAYESAADDQEALAEALMRNVYRGEANSQAQPLAAYVRECIEALKRHSIAQISHGELRFAQMDTGAAAAFS